MPKTLSCHPDFPADTITSVEAHVEYQAPGQFIFHYTVRGAPDQLLLPESPLAERADNLWQSTCFEAFIGAPGSPAYLELNFAPSGQWAAYAFSGYREAMSNVELVKAPQIETTAGTAHFELAAAVDLSGLAIAEVAGLDAALTAVIQEKNGQKSLWALSHAPGSPDFHKRECFVHKLEAVEPL